MTATQTGKLSQAELDFVLLKERDQARVIGARYFFSKHPELRYSYIVEGSSFFGTRVMPLDLIYLPRQMIVGLDSRSISISYDPENPHLSYIYPVVPTTQLSILGLVGFLSAGVAIFGPLILRVCYKYDYHNGDTKAA